MQKTETTPLLTPDTRINSKWTEDLNVRTETIKVLEETISTKLSDTVLSNIFLICPLRQREQKQINKWDYIKLKSLCTGKLSTKQKENQLKRRTYSPTVGVNIQNI